MLPLDAMILRSLRGESAFETTKKRYNEEKSPLPAGSARRSVLVYFESGTSAGGLKGFLRRADNAHGRLSLQRSAHLMLDTDDDMVSWALLAAIAGAILVGVGQFCQRAT